LRRASSSASKKNGRGRALIFEGGAALSTGTNDCCVESVPHSDSSFKTFAARWPVEEKIARPDFVIWTDGSRGVLAQQIERIAPKLQPQSVVATFSLRQAVVGK